MSVKKLTVMVLNTNNRSQRAVFDGDGNCVQGDDSLRSLAISLLDRPAETTPAPTPAPPADVDEEFDDSESDEA